MIAEKTVSPLVLAHVRAAGPGSGTPTELNCHPFSCGKFLFMHNGCIGDFEKIRRRVLSGLSEVAFNFAVSNQCIDSVLIFAVFIEQLYRGVHGDYTANELRWIYSGDYTANELCVGVIFWLTRLYNQNMEFGNKKLQNNIARTNPVNACLYMQ
eukprot:GHVS01079258.1.p2 GENE.GHVS01079258.1~~GHVS01079258.1.p2  ORF type:complete len:154 (+),score=15.57 GHVS01079258.1:354-815(+)